MRKLILTFSAGLAAMFSYGAIAAATAWQQADHIQVRLLSNVDTLSPDSTIFLGLELKPDEHWHVYWKNPGDSGMPIKFSLSDTPALQKEKLLWPIPEKIPFGDLTNFGYEGQLILPMQVKVSKVDDTTVIKSDASWLVCKESCIPGKASFEMQLPKGQSLKAAAEEPEIRRFAAEEARELPLMQGQMHDEGDHLSIELFARKPVFKDDSVIEFFPVNESLFSASAKAEMKWKNNFLKLKQKKSDSFFSVPELISGLLVIDGQAWEFSFKPSSN